MKPQNLKTKIFLDSGDPKETREIMGILGFLEGQTTNPTLIARNPDVRRRLEKGEKFAKGEIYDFYRGVVEEISGLIPGGSVSVEVYADSRTTAEEMVGHAKKMFSWVPNAHIKLPIVSEGLKAAKTLVKDGIRVNMTLCFSQEQAAAVDAATRGAKKGDVFISPFIGRLDDRGENGMDLILHILRMYREEGSRVEVLAASVRNYDHFLCSLKYQSDIVTAPFAVLKEWAEKDLEIPGDDYVYGPKNLKEIPYREIGLGKNWQDYDLSHELTEKGLERFSQDWNALTG